MKAPRHIKALFERFLEDKYSSEDLEELIRYLKENQNRESFLEVTEEVWEKLEAVEKLDSLRSAHILQRILAKEEMAREEEMASVRPFIFSMGWRIAAAVLILVVSSSIIYFVNIKNSQYRITTAYGEIKTILLPDSSEVVLNGNSALTYSKSWDEESKREVWLEGEAFFSVIHKKNHQRFIVNASEYISVEVLGTKFNVSKRQSGTKVVLNSGKINLHIEGRLVNREEDENLLLVPGELVELKKDVNNYNRRKVNPQLYSSWKDKRLILDNTSMTEIVTMLRETYGLKISIIDPTLLNKKVSGSMPNKSVNEILNQVAELFRVKIVKDGDSLIIINNNN